MKKLVYTIIVILIILIAAFLYFTRPVAAPTDITVNVPTVSTSTEAVYVFATGTMARFEIFEVLRGNDFTVVGTTTNVSGSVTVNNNVINGIAISPIRINARTFRTDDSRRDNAIARAILKSEDAQYEFIEFTPTGFTGVATSALAVGSSTRGTVTGDLKIIGVTKPASFTTEVTRTANGFTGSASTTIKRADYGIVIPSVPFVARAGEEVDLFLDFTLVNAQ